MKRLGMVVRDDNGGLGNLTREAFTHVKPDVTVVVQSRPCRGVPQPQYFQERCPETFLAGNPMTDAQWSDLSKRADVWWTAETWYNDNAETILKKAGVETVVYAMPELFSGSKATQVWNPTTYRHNVLPGRAEVVQWPTSPPDKWRLRVSVKNVLHISSGAQYDRNGTNVFAEALQKIEGQCNVLFHQPDADGPRLSGDQFKSFPKNVRAKQLTDYETDMNSLYKWADLLVLPRRYAGLCLPAFEAMGHGCLVMMPNVEPQNQWPIASINATPDAPRRMKGGRVPVWNIDPDQLARSLEGWLSAPPHPVVRLSEQSRAWAEANSWQRRLPEWTRRLR